MSFETDVTLGIEVDSGELRSAKRAIEDELGDVSVGVDSSRARADGGTSASGGDGRRNRRMFRWARQRTQHSEDMVELLAAIEGHLDDQGGLLGGGGGGGGGGGTNIIPLPGGGGRGPGLPGGGGVGISGILRNFAMSTGVIGLPFVQNQMPSNETSEELANRGPVQSFFADLGATFGINDAGTSFLDGGGGSTSARGQRNAELLRRQQQRNLAAPEWMRQFLSGQVDAPQWVMEARNGALFNTPSGQRAPDTPGGAQRVQINFEQTVEGMGLDPEELEQRVDAKLSELEREIARSTGRGIGGTPIP